MTVDEGSSTITYHRQYLNYYQLLQLLKAGVNVAYHKCNFFDNIKNTFNNWHKINRRQYYHFIVPLKGPMTSI